MTPERWKQVEDLFHAALGAAPDQRALFLARACPNDPDLVKEVESLLDSHAQASGFLETPALGDRVDIAGSDWLEEVPVTAMEGKRIGPYRLVRLIASGGMGTVWLAERADEQFQQQVAIKLVKKGMDTESILRRFRAERQTLANLDHPNIARLLDGGTTEDGLPYFVMEYIEGLPIDDYCDTHRLSVRDRLNLFRTVCSAIHYAHQNLVIHRDIKPGNILVTSDGVPKLLDFGIAKLLSPDMTSQTVEATGLGLRPMTPEYASPEQIRGDRITTATDVYSLGVLLYELLTGHRPYRLKTHLRSEIERIVCEEEPEKPSLAIRRVEEIVSPDGSTTTSITPESVSQTREGKPERLKRRLVGDLDTIVLMALRKESTRRYASVEQFSEDIRRCLEHQPVIARKDTLMYTAGKFVRRNKGAVTAGTLLLLTLVAGIVATAWQAQLAARQRNYAEGQRRVAELNLTRAVEAEDKAKSEAERARQAERRALDEASRAQEAQKLAAVNAQTASEEADTANQVSEFLITLFRVSNPDVLKGREITARQLLDAGAQRLRAELKDKPRIRARLLTEIARVYNAMGLLDRAIPMLNEAVSIYRKLDPPDEQGWANALDQLAGFLILTGDYVTAKNVLAEAISLRRKQAESSVHIAGELRGLAKVLLHEGKSKEGESTLREALSMARRFGDNDETGSCLTALATTLTMTGNHVEAEAAAREALALNRKLHGDDNSSTTNSMRALAEIVMLRGKLDEAEGLCRAALLIDTRLLGSDSLGVATGESTLAKVLYLKHDYGAAEKSLRHAVKVYSEIAGDANAEAFALMSNLAMILKESRKYKEAETLYDSLLQKLPRESAAYASQAPALLNNLGQLAGAQGQWSKAERLYRRAMEINERALGKDYPGTITNMHNLAMLLIIEDRLSEAAPLEKEVLERYRRVFGEDHPDTLAAEYAYATILRKKGDSEDAEKLYRHELTGRVRVLGKDTPVTLQNMSEVADFLAEQGKFTEAESMSREALEGLKRVLGNEHPDTLTAKVYLAILLQRKGALSQAEAMFENVLDARRRLFGDEHPDTILAMQFLAAARLRQGKLDEATRLMSEANTLKRKASSSKPSSQNSP